MGDQRRPVVRIAQQTRNIAQENEPACLEGDGSLRGRQIGIAIVNAAVLSPRGWADHWRGSASDALAQRLDIQTADFANETKINCFISRRIFSAAKNLGTGKSASFASKILNRGHDFGINFAR